MDVNLRTTSRFERSLDTNAEPAKLKVPKFRRQTFGSALIERNQCQESSVEEAIMEVYLAGVSVRRVEDITEAAGVWRRVRLSETRRTRQSVANTAYLGQLGDFRECGA